jgi:hypothetical protein
MWVIKYKDKNNKWRKVNIPPFIFRFEADYEAYELKLENPSNTYVVLKKM